MIILAYCVLCIAYRQLYTGLKSTKVHSRLDIATDTDTRQSTAKGSYTLLLV